MSAIAAIAAILAELAGYADFRIGGTVRFKRDGKLGTLCRFLAGRQGFPAAVIVRMNEGGMRVAALVQLEAKRTVR